MEELDKIKYIKDTKKKNFIDLTGAKIGKWTVLRYITINTWLCSCDCGTEKEVQGGLLRNRKSTQCRQCADEEQTKVKMDIKGMKFGRLTALEHTGKGSWRCKCDCGNTTNVKGFNLRANNIISCADCAIKRKTMDLEGKQFGEWLVLEKREGNGTHWKCRCSCGTEKDVSGKSLRYGVSNSCGCKTGEKLLEARLEKYGEICTTRLANKRTYDQIYALHSKNALITFIESKFSYKPKVIELVEALDTTASGILKKVHKFELKNIVDIGETYKSSYEYIIIIIEEIQKIDANIKIEQSNRTLIGGKELDIYCPNNKLAIEFNGTYWHSTIFKDKNYHQKKTLDCASKGIRLIHIFEYEWSDIKTREKLMNLIKQTIKQGSNRVIYGRQTKIVELESKESNELLDKYHLQGGANSSIRLGLMIGTELLGVMTFGKPRFNTNYEYELIRLVWKDSVSVVGGAEKLFQYFIKKYNPSNIITYCDISKFTGNVYTRLGFKADIHSITSPNYVWVDAVNNIVLSRYKTMKHKLIEDGLDSYGNTEDEIMDNLGYLKIYDSGNLKLLWNNKGRH